LKAREAIYAAAAEDDAMADIEDWKERYK